MTNTLLPPFEETLEGSTFNLRINTVKYNLNSVIFENLDIFNDCLIFVMIWLNFIKIKIHSIMSNLKNLLKDH